MEIFLDHYRHSPSKKTLIVLQKIISDNFLANKQKSFPTLKGFQEKIGMQKESNRCPLFPLRLRGNDIGNSANMLRSWITANKNKHDSIL